MSNIEKSRTKVEDSVKYCDNVNGSPTGDDNDAKSNAITCDTQSSGIAKRLLRKFWIKDLKLL